jgi:hypothetical protein
VGFFIFQGNVLVVFTGTGTIDSQSPATQRPILALIQAKSNYFSEMSGNDQTGHCAADSSLK